MHSHSDSWAIADNEEEPAPELSREVQTFYELFPCGGDATSDDERWVRLPWMEDEFRPEDWTGQWVLDMGCGIGADLERFVQGGAVSVGVDFASAPLGHAQHRLSAKVPRGTWHLVRADARFLPFKPGAFDYLYSNGVVHHIPDYRAALREAHRCLTDGGQGTVLVYHKTSLMTLLTILFRRLTPRREHGMPLDRLSVLTRKSPSSRAGYAEVARHPLIQYFSRRAWEVELQDAGFRRIRTRTYDWAFPLLRKVRRRPGLLDRWFGRFLVSRFAKGEQLGAQP